MVKVKKNKFEFKFKDLKRYIMFIGGLLCISLAFNLFLLPSNIVNGGVSGISIIIRKFINVDPALVILIASIILLLMSLIFLGKEQTLRSVVGSLLLPAFVKLTANIGNILPLDVDNQLLSAVFGGAIFGMGAGLVFKAGFTSGGTDILNQIVSKYGKVSMGRATILTDGFIVLVGGFVFGWVKFMYALVTLAIVSMLVDRVLLGISDCKAFYIITEKQEEISKFVFEELGHTITLFNAKGGYSNTKNPVLFAVIPTKEYFKFKEGIREIDKNAFFVVTDAYEVKGGE